MLVMIGGHMSSTVSTSGGRTAGAAAFVFTQLIVGAALLAVLGGVAIVVLKVAGLVA
jgi:hypothetical protein